MSSASKGYSKLLPKWDLCAVKWHGACLPPATTQPAPDGRMPKACPGVLQVHKVHHENKLSATSHAGNPVSPADCNKRKLSMGTGR